MPDVPYLCHYQRAVDIAAAGPYLELQRYFQVYPHHVEQALRTLSYHDAMNLAAGIAPQVRLLCSVGLWDDVCPPSTVYAAFNHAGVERKEMAVYPYNKHEGGGGWHMERKIAFLSECLAE
ncbi:MAG: acetylxylan esterase, partial [Armatimonadetes bacterium]|nr:acetylxylan esterase [Armatimonadota bacterium]